MTKKAAVIIAVLVVIVLAVIGVTRSNSGSKPGEDTAATTESVSPTGNQADQTAASDPDDTQEPETVSETGDGSVNTSQAETEGDHGDETEPESGNKPADVSKPESGGQADIETVPADGEMPIHELETVEMEPGDTPDSGSEQTVNEPQSTEGEENETSMMTDF